MLRKYIHLAALFAIPLISAGAQDTVTLSWCLEKVALNHPRAGNEAIIENMTNDKVRNARTGYLPQMELNGKASYQSDAISVDMDIPIPGIVFPQSPKDQYKLSLDITQSIYDGGYVKNRQIVEKTAEKVEKSQLEIDIHATKMQVKDLYYNILIIQKNQESIDLSINQMIENRAVIETGIKNGVLLKTDLDLINVEIIKLKQKKTELENSRQAGMMMLSLKTGEQIKPDAILVSTDFNIPDSDSIKRLEQILFDLQSEQLGSNKELIRSRTLPKVYAFGQFGYGNPALNMLKDEFDTYYILGAGLKWTIWDWKTTSRDRNILSLQQNILNSRKLQFETDINSALVSQKSDIFNREENLKAFREILKLRSNITSVSKLQLEQGIIKTLDFIAVINQETLARIQFENEKILLQQSIAKYLELKGEL